MSQRNFYDPQKDGSEGMKVTNSAKEYTREAIALANRLVQENRKAGQPEPNCFILCMIHKKTGQHRWFNVSPDYAGRVGHAEALATGLWRRAKQDEWPARKKQDEDAAEVAKHAADKKQVALAQRALNAMAKVALRDLPQQQTETAKE